MGEKIIYELPVVVLPGVSREFKHKVSSWMVAEFGRNVNLANVEWDEAWMTEMLDNAWAIIYPSNLNQQSPTHRLQFCPTFCLYHGMKLLLPVLMGFPLLLLSSTEGRSADFQKGLDGGNKGGFAAALRESKPLAEQGPVPKA